MSPRRRRRFFRSSTPGRFLALTLPRIAPLSLMERLDLMAGKACAPRCPTITRTALEVLRKARAADRHRVRHARPAAICRTPRGGGFRGLTRRSEVFHSLRLLRIRHPGIPSARPDSHPRGDACVVARRGSACAPTRLRGVPAAPAMVVPVGRPRRRSGAGAAHFGKPARRSGTLRCANRWPITSTTSRRITRIL